MPDAKQVHYRSSSDGPPGHYARASVRYSVAVVAVLLALVVRLGLDRLVGEDFQPYAAAYVAVAFVAWWAGIGPGVLAVLLGLLSTLWVIVPPRNSLAIRGTPDLLEILIYLFVVATILSLTSAMHKARVGLARANAHLETMVQERTAKLQQAVEDLEHFSHALVHDMRAPLRAMHSYATLLEGSDEPANGPLAHEFCRRIRSSAERLDALITDSLSYTKILRDEMPLYPIELSTFMRELIESYPGLERHSPSIRIEAPLPWVRANEAALTQCFANLLDNALKFVAEGVAPSVLIRAEERGDLCRIWVCDNGIGIRPEDQRHIFEMFHRGVHQYEGTGIGLAIVRKAMQRMGGRVGVESEAGKGSRFWLELHEVPARDITATNEMKPSRQESNLSGPPVADGDDPQGGPRGEPEVRALEH